MNKIWQQLESFFWSEAEHHFYHLTDLHLLISRSTWHPNEVFGQGDTIRVSLTEDPEFEAKPCVALRGTAVREVSGLAVGSKGRKIYKIIKMNETKPIALPELTIFRYFGWKCPHGDFWMIHDIQYIENWIHILATLQLYSRFSGVAEQALGKACLENEVKCKQVLEGKETCNTSNRVEHGRKHDKMSTWQLTIHYCLVSREVKGDLEAMLLVAGVCQWLARSRACQL